MNATPSAAPPGPGASPRANAPRPAWGPAPDRASGPALDRASGAAFAAMYTEEYPRVLAFCRHRVGDLSTAEDLTAEVFRIAWERLGDDPPGPGWLFVTAKHVMANHRRAAIRLVEVLRVAAREARPSPAPDADLRVAAAMDALPEAQRTVLLLSYWDELTGAECGAVLGCSVPAVWMRLTRARAAFKTIFTTLEVQP